MVSYNSGFFRIRLNPRKNVNDKYRVFLEFRYRIIGYKYNIFSITVRVIIGVTTIIVQVGRVIAIRVIDI